MALSEDAVLEQLKNVIDPELFVNIVDLGLIYEIHFDEPTENSAAAAPAENAVAADAPQTAEPPAPHVGDACCSVPQSVPSPETADLPLAGGGCCSGASNGDKKNVRIHMTMTSPACPAGPQLIAGAQREVGALEGVAEVNVKIVLDPPWTPDRMTEDAKDQLGIF